MSTSSLVRLSGLAGLIGGSLWIVVAIAFSAFLAGKPESVTALTGTWSIINGIDLFLGSIFVSLALIGLYARQAREIGGYGLVCLPCKPFWVWLCFSAFAGGTCLSCRMLLRALRYFWTLSRKI